jgi:WXXGXW repeat (2 copies)
MRQKLPGAALVLAGALLAGCGQGYGALYVRNGPPPPRYGVVGVAPGPGFVWTPGYWDWRSNNWFWVQGRWLRPPRRRAVWVAPEWRHEGRGWRFHRGRWR